MGPTHDQPGALQARLDQAPPGSVVQLPPGEYPGPMVVRRPLTLDGRGATVWALSGPVLAVDADGVRLRNLRVEVTGGPAAGDPGACALLVCSGRRVGLENVTVRARAGQLMKALKAKP